MDSLLISLDVIIGDATYSLKRIESESIKCIVTSPPYATEVETLKGDQLLGDVYLSKMRIIFREALRTLRKDGVMFLNVGDSANNWFLSHDLVRQMAAQDDWKLVHRIIWWKPRTKLIGTGGRFLGGNKQLLFNYDFIYLLAKSKEYVFEFIDDDVWEFWKSEKGYKNPSIFPVELPMRCMKLATEEGDTVLDPFLGSGSTLVACKRMNRNGIGCELNNDYKDDIRNRIGWGLASLLTDTYYRWIDDDKIEEVFAPKVKVDVSVRSTFQKEGLDQWY